MDPDEWVSFEDLDVRNEIRELGRRMGVEVTTGGTYEFLKRLLSEADIGEN